MKHHAEGHSHVLLRPVAEGKDPDILIPEKYGIVIELNKPDVNIFVDPDIQSATKYHREVVSCR